MTAVELQDSISSLCSHGKQVRGIKLSLTVTESLFPHCKPCRFSDPACSVVYQIGSPIYRISSPLFHEMDGDFHYNKLPLDLDLSTSAEVAKERIYCLTDWTKLQIYRCL